MSRYSASVALTQLCARAPRGLVTSRRAALVTRLSCRYSPAGLRATDWPPGRLEDVDVLIPVVVPALK
jgi:hypothetical protein